MACVVVVTLLFACKTDLDVNAPYKNVTIVYALLNKDDDTSWVKINKAFLGKGDAFQYAQIPDSNEFTDAQLHAYVEELDANGSLLNTLTLHPKIVNRDLGIFFAPQHKLYWFRSNAGDGKLDPAHKYRLKAVAKGTSIEAETALVQDISIHFAVVSTTSTMSLATNGAYATYGIQWATGANGKRFDVYYKFLYYEVASPTDSTLKSFTSLIGTRTSNGLAGGEQLSVSLDGEAFYQAVHTNVLAQAGPTVIRRNFVGVDLLWSVAGPDLYTYLQLGNPVSGIVEERPDYSNVQNGYGLFTTRFFDSVSKHNAGAYKRLNNQSLIELIQGHYTNGLQF